MAAAVCANNLGVMWVAIEATTVVTAFLVGHRRTRTALEAAWKYVIICSVGIAMAFLGTVLLYFAARHAGGPARARPRLDVLVAHAERPRPRRDPPRRRAAPARVRRQGRAASRCTPGCPTPTARPPHRCRALMCGVLLSVAFSPSCGSRSIVDAALGPGFLRTLLLVARAGHRCRRRARC